MSLKLENSLALHNATLRIVKKVVCQVKELEQYEAKKFDSELTKAVCRLVDKLVRESCVGDKPDLSKKQAETIDKKAVVGLVLCEVFNLSQEEKDVVDSQIDFILENKLLKRSMLRRAGKFFYRLVLSLRR